MNGANTNIALITKYSTEGFDQVYMMEACSSVLTRDSDMIKFLGSKTVKVAKMAFGGLSDYNRNNYGDPRVSFGGAGNPADPTDAANPDAPYYGNGYGESEAALSWEEFTITMDRAAKYPIEKFDNEESGGLMVGKGVTEINRTQIVPEIDAYCFAKIYENAGTKVDDYKTITVNGAAVAAPIAALNDAFTVLSKAEVPDEDQVIFTSVDYMNALRNTQEVVKPLLQGDFSKDVKFRMTTYEGRPLIVVPPKRFQTGQVFVKRGFHKVEAADVTALAANPNLYKHAGDITAPAKDIDFIVMARSAAVHIKKFEQTRILTGDAALAATNMDAYVIYARIYHDVFVPDNKRVAIYAHTGWFATRNAQGTVTATVSSAPTLAINLMLKATKTSGKAEIVRNIAVPGNVVYNILNHTGNATITVGTSKIGAATNNSTHTVAFSEFVPVGVGDVIDSTTTAAAKLYVSDVNGLIIGTYNGTSGMIAITGVTLTTPQGGGN